MQSFLWNEAKRAKSIGQRSNAINSMLYVSNVDAARWNIDSMYDGVSGTDNLTAHMYVQIRAMDHKLTFTTSVCENHWLMWSWKLSESNSGKLNSLWKQSAGVLERILYGSVSFKYDLSKLSTSDTWECWWVDRAASEHHDKLECSISSLEMFAHQKEISDRYRLIDSSLDKA